MQSLKHYRLLPALLALGLALAACGGAEPGAATPVAEVATQGEEALKCLAELACPAFRRGGTAEAPVVSVDESQCSGCMVCLQVTPAIRARKRS